jgi:hypothetical protein
MKQPTNQYGVYFGTPTDKIEAISAAINSILSMPYVDNKTKQLAIKALQSSCSIQNATVSNVSVDMGK